MQLWKLKVSAENARVPVTVIHLEGNLDSSTYVKFQEKADES
ncbi:MAG: hypothetical protein U0Z26_03515 [Anaerolineales bacterium]